MYRLINLLCLLSVVSVLSSCIHKASKSEMKSMTQTLFNFLQQEYNSPDSANIELTKYAFDRYWESKQHTLGFKYSYVLNDTLVEILGHAVFSKDLNIDRQVNQQCVYITDVKLNGDLLDDSIAEYSKYVPRNGEYNTLNYYFMHHSNPNNKPDVNYISNEDYCAQLKSNGAADAFISDDGFLHYGAKHGQVVADPNEVAKLWYEDAVGTGVVGLKGCYIVLLPEEKIIGIYKKRK